jgi:hypothetical protein
VNGDRARLNGPAVQFHQKRRSVAPRGGNLRQLGHQAAEFNQFAPPLGRGPCPQIPLAVAHCPHL